MRTGFCARALVRLARCARYSLATLGTRAFPPCTCAAPPAHCPCAHSPAHYLPDVLPSCLLAIRRGHWDRADQRFGDRPAMTSFLFREVNSGMYAPPAHRTPRLACCLRLCLWPCGGRHLPEHAAACAACVPRVSLPACRAGFGVWLLPRCLGPCLPESHSPACVTPAPAPPAPPCPCALAHLRFVSVCSISEHRVPVRRPLLCSSPSSRAGNPGATARVGGARPTQ